MRVAGVDPQSVTEQTLGFALAPRINAAGRLYRADAGLELVLTEDDERAREIARELDAVNSERQSVETADPARGRGAARRPPERLADPAHVLAGEGWHPGVVGIVASRLVERYHRPFVLIGLDGGRGPRVGAQHRSLRPARGARGLRRAPRALRRSPHGGRAGARRASAGPVPGRAPRTRPPRAAAGGSGAHRARGRDRAGRCRRPRAGRAAAGDEAVRDGQPWRAAAPAGRPLRAAARWGRENTRASRSPPRACGPAGGCLRRRGQRAMRSATAGPRHDITPRLEINEWAGAVEPRLVLRRARRARTGRRGGGRRGACAGCAADGAEGGWQAVWREPSGSASAGRAAREQAGPRRSSTARRGAARRARDLLSTRRAAADRLRRCSRRRALFERALAPVRFGAAAPRLRVDALRRTRLAGPEGVRRVVRGRSRCARARPGSACRFAHVFVLDPPASRALRRRCGGRPRGGRLPAPRLERGGDRLLPRGARARARAAAGADRDLARPRRPPAA